MTMPFRFAPGCCDPCNPCGKTYSPEQFTVVSGTYDTETHMLSPGGILTVPYSGNNIYALVAIKVENQLESLADVTYLYGNDPIEVSVPANSNIATVTHGTMVCNATLTDTDNSAESTKAGPPNEIHPFIVTVFATTEYRILLQHNIDMVPLPESFFDYLPSIKNEGSTDVKVDKIVFYEHLPDLEDAACNLIRRCGGYYEYAPGTHIPFSNSSQFDNVSEIDIKLAGTGCILNELAGDYMLTKEGCIWDCYYKARFSGKMLTLHIPTFNNRYVENIEHFSFPDEITLVPVTLELQGIIRLLPVNEGECMIDIVFDSGKYTSSMIQVSSWRYNLCPAASGVWKSTPDGGTRPLYCWTTQNAGFSESSANPFEVQVFAAGKVMLPYSSVDFENGVSDSVDIALSGQSGSYDKCPVSCQGNWLPNTETWYFEGEHIVEFPGLEPCVEGYKTCPYSGNFWGRGLSIGSYLQTHPVITASITGITHVL